MTDTASELSFFQRRISLIAVLVHMLAVGVTIGVFVPLSSLVLESWGVETWLIGIVAAMPSVAIVVLMPLAPRLLGWVGAYPAMVLGCLISVVAILLMPLLPSVAAWIVLRFVAGAGLALPWLVGETWLNAAVLDRWRGRVLALYGASLFLGFAIGPQLLAVTGTAGWRPFLLCAAALISALLPIVAVRRLAPRLVHEPTLRILSVLRLVPTATLAAFVAGLLEAACYTLLPLYGLRVGMSEVSSLHLLSIFLLGGIVLQVPVGWLADKLPRAWVLVGLGVVAMVAAALLPFTVSVFWLLAPATFVLGAALLGFYVVGLSILGQDCAPQNLAVANAAFIMLYELGSVAGPALAGVAMDLWQPHGLIATIFVIALALALAVLAKAPGRSRR
jgi:MFS family permease